jgi:anti-anti-sigma factor
VNRLTFGQDAVMEQPAPAAQPDADGPAPGAGDLTVTCTRDGETARIEVVGELTDTARRPLVRELTDLMLSSTPLKRVDLDLCEVSFLNSAGIAALVQLQKMVQPRGIELTLAVKDVAVTRPLQLSGLWHRFTVLDLRHDTAQEVHEPLPPGREHS